MLAKLNAVREALAQGASQVHICNGHIDDSLESGIFYEQEKAASCRRQGGIDGMLSETSTRGTTVFASAAVSGARS